MSGSLSILSDLEVCWVNTQNIPEARWVGSGIGIVKLKL